MEKVKDANKEIKKLLKIESSRIFKSKAMSPDPKKIWLDVNSSLGKKNPRDLEITINGAQTQDQELLANAFADFFLGKVSKLSDGPTERITLELPKQPLMFSNGELVTIMKSIKTKNALDLTQFLRDVYPSISLGFLELLNTFAKKASR